MSCSEAKPRLKALQCSESYTMYCTSNIHLFQNRVNTNFYRLAYMSSNAEYTIVEESRGTFRLWAIYNLLMCMYVFYLLLQWGFPVRYFLNWTSHLICGVICNVFWEPLSVTADLFIICSFPDPISCSLVVAISKNNPFGISLPKMFSSPGLMFCFCFLSFTVKLYLLLWCLLIGRQSNL